MTAAGLKRIYGKINLNIITYESFANLLQTYCCEMSSDSSGNHNNKKNFVLSLPTNSNLSNK